VLGLGYATLVPDNGVTALKVADVDAYGSRVSSSTRARSTPPPCWKSARRARRRTNSANPTTVQDVFVRIGGAGAGKATTSMVINNRHTIVDHTWVWRADHGTGVGWDTNRATTAWS